MRNNQKGFAIILMFFLVIAISLVLAGNFISLGMQQRTIQRTADRIRLAWAAEAVIDRTFKVFNDYVRANGFPSAEADASGDLVVYEESEGSKVLFQKNLETWFDSPFLKPQKGGNYRFDGLQHIQVQSLKVLVDPATQVSENQRLYEVRIRLHHPLTRTSVEYSQKIQVRTGRLFDYAVFYNTDLEIAAGPDWELQGPIFSNGNVYLMTGSGSRLTLRMPPDDSTNTEYYALRSAGNIYFYFKTALAENYFLKNNKYRAAVPDFYKTDESSHPFYVEGTKGVEVYGEPAAKRFLGYDADEAPPFVYTFRNSVQYGGATAHTILVVKPGETKPYVLLSSAVPSTPIRKTEASCDFPSKVPYAESYKSGVGNDLSVSAAIGPSRAEARKLLPGWEASNPVSTAPMVNPFWTGFPKKSDLRSAMIADHPSHGVTRHALPVGGKDLAPHKLIEPLALNGDEDRDGDSDDPQDQRIRRYKYQTCASLVFRCVDADCRTYKLFIHKAGATTVSSLGFSSGLLDGSEANGVYLKENFYDYRLRRSARLIEINVKTFLNRMRQRYGLDFSTDKPVIYVQTVPAYPVIAESAGPLLVKVSGGAELPLSGLSVVTNGRLWVQGDYNIYPYDADGVLLTDACSAEELKSGACATNERNVPPADLYSDSFGVLSNSWNSDNETAAQTLESRVASDTILNAAVVTGHLPSQLVKPLKPAIWSMPSCDLKTEPVESQPDRTPCLYFGDDQFNFYESPGVPASVYDENGIGYLNPDSELVQRLKSNNTIMEAAGSTFQYYLDKTTVPYNLVREYYRRSSASVPYPATPSRTDPPIPGTQNVNTYRLPQDYFKATDPLKIPITEAVRDNSTAAGVDDGYIIYKRDGGELPFPSMGYPGVTFRRIRKGYGEVDAPLQYACVKNWIESYKQTAQTPSSVYVCDPPTEEKTVPACRWISVSEWKTETSARTSHCICGAKYDNVNPDKNNNRDLLTKFPDWTVDDPATTDNEESPSWLGSGLCPDRDQNYFPYFPKLRYTWKAQGPLWEAKYSGGLENLINFQELWYDTKGTPNSPADDTRATLHFRGSLVSGWDSEEMKRSDGTPAFFGTTYYYWSRAAAPEAPYYTAPVRDYSFNDKLRTNPPPLPYKSGMLLFSIVRRDFREEPVKGTGYDA